MDDGFDIIKNINNIIPEEKKSTFEKIEDYIFSIDIFRKLKWFYQRHTRGWDDTELWGLDECFAEWIVPRLKGYRDLYNPPRNGFGVGIPNDIYEKYNEDEDKATEVWCGYLDEMIYGFEEKINSNYGSTLTYDMHRKYVNRAMELYAKYWEELWD